MTTGIVWHPVHGIHHQHWRWLLFVFVILNKMSLLMYTLQSWSIWPWGWGQRGTQQSFIWGGPPLLEVGPLILLYANCDRQGIPFEYLLLINLNLLYPIHMHSLELCIPLNCCRWCINKMHKSQEFKMNQLAPPLSLLSDQNGKIPYPSYTSTYQYRQWIWEWVISWADHYSSKEVIGK